MRVLTREQTDAVLESMPNAGYAHKEIAETLARIEIGQSIIVEMDELQLAPEAIGNYGKRLRGYMQKQLEGADYRVSVRTLPDKSGWLVCKLGRTP